MKEPRKSDANGNSYFPFTRPSFDSCKLQLHLFGRAELEVLRRDIDERLATPDGRCSK